MFTQTMPIHRIVKNLPRPASRDDISATFHEPHVETGFRPSDQPWHYYLLSLFQKHNECMNAWTHFIGCALAMDRIFKMSHEFDAWNDPWMYPMLSGCITMVIMYLCSALAHTFHNKSEQLHYTCFFVDYAGIGVYGLGGTIIHYFYCTDLSLLQSVLHRYAISVGCVLAVLVCFYISYLNTTYTKPYPLIQRLLQMTSVLSIYLWLSLPIIHRLYLFALHPFTNDWDQSLRDHALQMVWFTLGGFFFGSHIPQRFFPGKCDFLFHSHQIFHVCIMMMNLKQIDGMYADIKLKRDLIKQHVEVPTVWNTFGPVVLVLLVDVAVIYYFHEKARRRIESSALKKDEIQR